MQKQPDHPLIAVLDGVDRYYNGFSRFWRHKSHIQYEKKMKLVVASCFNRSSTLEYASASETDEYAREEL